MVRSQTKPRSKIARKVKTPGPGRCSRCGRTHTTQWRLDWTTERRHLPREQRRLCNSCGIKFNPKKAKKASTAGACVAKTTKPRKKSSSKALPKKKLKISIAIGVGKAEKVTSKQVDPLIDDVEAAGILHGMQMPFKARPLFHQLAFRPSWLSKSKSKPIHRHTLPLHPSSMPHYSLSHHCIKASRPNTKSKRADHSKSCSLKDVPEDPNDGPWNLSPVSEASTLMPVTPTSGVFGPWATEGLLVEEEDCDMEWESDSNDFGKDGRTE